MDRIRTGTIYKKVRIENLILVRLPVNIVSYGIITMVVVITELVINTIGRSSCLVTIFLFILETNLDMEVLWFGTIFLLRLTVISQLIN